MGELDLRGFDRAGPRRIVGSARLYSVYSDLCCGQPVICASGVPDFTANRKARGVPAFHGALFVAEYHAGGAFWAGAYHHSGLRPDV